EDERVEHGIKPEVTVAAIERCGDVVRRARSDEESRGSVYCAFDRLVIPTRTEPLNHGPGPPLGDCPSVLQQSKPGATETIRSVRLFDRFGQRCGRLRTPVAVAGIAQTRQSSGSRAR